ncbi:MAG: UDP-N-acetylglucosamine 1-carboxyvinyltransferase [Parcubacteria group bacterium]|jgi:UDP-N-acetylglucosamine 1-carboxyvinyltransferase|nr:UDP-N-acetylglucosamine 1-carboxyvinyltransferase [Parcubacteria group bacterium]|tara:strand:+ start:4638 stop:5891 length:1254 start_codon:yes stop_codon:yes gene_type:complete
MERFIIKGGKPLKGTIKVKGAKNAALKLLAACLLTDQPWIISNVPQIEDILHLIELLKGIGVEVKRNKDTYTLRAKKIKTTVLDANIARKLKASILLAGLLLVRQGEVVFPQSGGCVIGQRPRDIFIDGFKAFGVKVRQTKQGYHLSAKKLKGAKFVFPIVSVTATEAMILMAVLAQGKTVLKNAACEPEIVCLTQFLNQSGAKIKGAGTPLIEIEGVKRLIGGQCRVIPDRLEAGSFVILGLMTNSPIKVTGLDSEHLDVFWSFLKRVGANLKIAKNSALIKPGSKLKAVNLKTHEYPGFPTDLQAPFTVLMTQAQGLSLIHETIFDGRLFYTDMLNQMGAQVIMCDPHRVMIQGPSKLYGRRLISPDIRAGVALVIAALAAQGESVIENIYQIDRGYERIENRLSKIGADIRRIN